MILRFKRGVLVTSLIGVLITGGWFSNTAKVLALPQSEVFLKLSPIKVFVFTNNQGKFLTAFQKDGTEITNIYMSRDDAQKYLEEVRNKDPQLAKQLQLSEVSLAEIYKIAWDNKEKLFFSFFPKKEQVQLAREIKTNNPEGLNYSEGVPLFSATVGENQSFLTFEKNGNRIIPFFLDKNQLQTLIDSLSIERPELKNTVNIQIISLEQMINLLIGSDNKHVENIQLIPPETKLKID